jgi:hypothetical protein
MRRSLLLEIDRSTWPITGSPVFPLPFHGTAGTLTVHIPSTLLMIGFLTTPATPIGPSLSQFWAWVRYVNALTNDAELKLTRSFEGIDAHQKTILSDDFGMGVPMAWLTTVLDFRCIVDGRFFIRHLAERFGVTARRTKKRGKNKSPDFVALDAAGIWHIVECKGTQSGSTYSDKQIGNPKSRKRNGGIAQKKAIKFPPGYQGQRLVAGLSIGLQSKGTGTRLRIVDPPAAPSFHVRDDMLAAAKDTIVRAALAKFLRLGGFDDTANLLVAPQRQSHGRIGRRSLQQRLVLAREELTASLAPDQRTSTTRGKSFRNRDATFDLSKPVGDASSKFKSAHLRQSISRALIERLSQLTVDQLVSDEMARVLDLTVGLASSGEGGNAKLEFSSDLRLEIELQS